MYELGFPLLERKVSIVNDMKNSFKKHWELHGCTLMLDGWTYVTDRTKRKLINFLVNCPEGTFYLYSINFSEKEETVDYLVKIIEQCMKQIGKKNVVQVCEFIYNTYLSLFGWLAYNEYNIFLFDSGVHLQHCKIFSCWKEAYGETSTYFLDSLCCTLR